MRYLEPFVGGGAVFFSLVGGSPFLRWVGGKRKLADQVLRELMGQTSGLFDAYDISDANPDLIAAYQSIRDQPEELGDLLLRLRQDAETFETVRAMRPESTLLRGMRAIWLNLHCHSGLWRVNSQGHFNVPPQPSRFTSVNMERYVRMLQVDTSPRLLGAHIECRDYSQALDECGAGDYVYCDPDYLPDKTSQFVGYVEKSDSYRKHQDIALRVRYAVGRGARVVLSNSPSARSLYEAAFQGLKFEVRELSVQRNIGVGKGKKVKRRQDEILVTVSRD